MSISHGIVFEPKIFSITIIPIHAIYGIYPANNGRIKTISYCSPF
jgi:hypothetical protein